MPTIEERVAFIEGQMSEQTHVLAELRDAIRHLDQKMDARFDLVDRRFGGVDERAESMDRRFEQMDRHFGAIEVRFEQMDRRFETIDRRFEAVDRRIEGLERRIETLDDKLSRHFLWLVGTQVTTLVAIVGALLARS
jgi:chromosome segregation ATPase